ncbi:MAG: GTP 3',8-cyclase MoaA [Candidatus Delongbacteria bacterium]|nr:GTP 3',8-cyclase MoaA [Candidatus Delongbacteria bacterium]MBN2835468.1 GTP 3',8-cyclase MoaA [Candidatus Delongbacteria bacterium]
MADYLRISITDRCNLNCVYCKPMENRTIVGHNDILRFEEIAKIVSVFTKFGIKKIRITGGEPLIKRGVDRLVNMIRNIDNSLEISITTNGVNLSEYASLLKDAGLDRINISLDSLKGERFKEITGFDKLDEVKRGIDSTLEAGFKNTKLNVVLLKNINDDEILDFVNFALMKNLNLRFIELFETNRNVYNFNKKTVPTNYVKSVIVKEFGLLLPDENAISNGPSENFSLSNGLKVGFISNNSSDFCGECTRLRMNSAGKVSPCLFSGFRYDMKQAIRNSSFEEIENYAREIMESKKDFTKKNRICSIEMSGLGG